MLRSFGSVLKEYLRDTYQFSCLSHLQRLERVGDHWQVHLDRTVFHPQGGGQPSDIGFLTQGSTRFQVTAAALAGQDPVHIGHFEQGEGFDAAQPIFTEVNAELRLLHARLHSAGHAIDLAVSEILPELVPTKGFHYPGAAYVEYKGTLPSSDRSALTIELNTALQGIIGRTQEDVQTQDYTLAQAQAELQWTGPDWPLIRVVRMNSKDPGCPCGGTHVRNLAELAGVTITKISKKGKTVRISYCFD